LRRSAEQAEKTLTDAIQGWRLKASLFTLKFRFEEAEKAYETALHYINRETNPRLRVETEVDVGITWYWSESLHIIPTGDGVS